LPIWAERLCPPAPALHTQAERIDILTPSVHCYDTVKGTDAEVKLGSMVSIAIPKATDGLLLATPTGLMTFDLASKSLAAFCRPESDRPTSCCFGGASLGTR